MNDPGEYRDVSVAMWMSSKHGVQRCVSGVHMFLRYQFRALQVDLES